MDYFIPIDLETALKVTNINDVWTSQIVSFPDKLELDGPKPASQEEIESALAQQADRDRAAALNVMWAQQESHKIALASARELLLDYGTPGSFTFAETLIAVQEAVLAYRDSGIKDPECEEHLLWISLRSNEISSLRELGILP